MWARVVAYRFRMVDPGEQLAGDTLAALSGATAVPHDDGSGSAMYDITLRFDDGTFVAVEVTRHANEPLVKFVNSRNHVGTVAGMADFVHPNTAVAGAMTEIEPNRAKLATATDASARHLFVWIDPSAKDRAPFDQRPRQHVADRARRPRRRCRRVVDRTARR